MGRFHDSSMIPLCLDPVFRDEAVPVVHTMPQARSRVIAKGPLVIVETHMDGLIPKRIQQYSTIFNIENHSNGTESAKFSLPSHHLSGRLRCFTSALLKMAGWPGCLSWDLFVTTNFTNCRPPVNHGSSRKARPVEREMKLLFFTCQDAPPDATCVKTLLVIERYVIYIYTNDYLNDYIRIY